MSIISLEHKQNNGIFMICFVYSTIVKSFNLIRWEHWWGQVKVWILKGDNSHSKCISKPFYCRNIKFSVKTVYNCCDLDTQSKSLSCLTIFILIVSKKITTLKFLPHWLSHQPNTDHYIGSHFSCESNRFEVPPVGIKMGLEAADNGCCDHIIGEAVPICHNSLREKGQPQFHPCEGCKFLFLFLFAAIQCLSTCCLCERGVLDLVNVTDVFLSINEIAAQCFLVGLPKRMAVL